MEDLKKDSADFAIHQASRATSSQGLLVQCYCNSVIEQPPVALKDFKNLIQYEKQINDGLDRAKGHADYYLGPITDMIFLNNTNIAEYYGLYGSVMSSLTSDYSEKSLIKKLNTLIDHSGQHLIAANDTVSKLRTFNRDLGNDTASFSKIVGDLNGAVNGDNGVLQGFDTELGTLQSKIDGAIAGIALSGFAIIGGVFIIIVGAIAELPTAGTSTSVVLGGIALLSAGIGGEIGSAITLANLNNQKSKLIHDKFDLQAEVKLAQGMSSGYSSLKNQAAQALNAVTMMSNAWTLMGHDLGKVITNVEEGKMEEGDMRKIFFSNADKTIARVLRDTENIRNQMIGVTQIAAPEKVSLSDHIKAVSENPEKYTAAAA